MAAAVTSPLRAFLHAESAGGIVLVIAAVSALVWANSPAADGYAQFWQQKVTLGSGQARVTHDLRHWVNDGLMVLFFFVIGLEIKRELVVGELRDRRAATLPALAAVGGVVLPALLYVAVVGGGEAGRGWGIPMATDIAFAVGILALLGRRASTGAKLFLLSVAIVDDILAIGVIAVFYTDRLSLGWLAGTVAGLLVAVGMRRLGVNSPWAYVPVGVLVWFATLESGVHATLAGVALGLLTPARPVAERNVLDDLERSLHPVSAFLVIPVFALANAGVDLRGGLLADAFGQPVTWAIISGLVVGKITGIGGVTYLARRLNWGALPANMHHREILGAAALGGIGFTVSLFITDLAFTEAVMIGQAKVGILTASAVAALVGTVLLLTAPAGTGVTTTPSASNEDRSEN
ncbi:Na+/H+ antiporter NhaA [Streptomyces sp. NPDC096538]|uniref:Na+/H+ antiporter NhaA n=1 Tax=Streptomyces sp. NPDC096538 TaxID=3155427 RepID=UPI003331F740